MLHCVTILYTHGSYLIYTTIIILIMVIYTDKLPLHVCTYIWNLYFLATHWVSGLKIYSYSSLRVLLQIGSLRVLLQIYNNETEFPTYLFDYSLMVWYIIIRSLVYIYQLQPSPHTQSPVWLPFFLPIEARQPASQWLTIDTMSCTPEIRTPR